MSFRARYSILRCLESSKRPLSLVIIMFWIQPTVLSQRTIPRDKVHGGTGGACNSVSFIANYTIPRRLESSKYPLSIDIIAFRNLPIGCATDNFIVSRYIEEREVVTR